MKRMSLVSPLPGRTDSGRGSPGSGGSSQKDSNAAESPGETRGGAGGAPAWVPSSIASPAQPYHPGKAINAELAT